MWLIDAFSLYLYGLKSLGAALLRRQQIDVVGLYGVLVLLPAKLPSTLKGKGVTKRQRLMKNVQGAADDNPSALWLRLVRAYQSLLTALRKYPAGKVSRLLPFCLLMSGCAMARNTMPTTAFFYGSPVPVAALSQFDRVVVEAENVKDLDGLRASGSDVFAYVSVGEAESWRTSSRALPKDLFLGTNIAWNSRIADLTQPGWRDYLIEQRMAQLWGSGYRSFFLDTLDSYQLVAKNPDEQLAQSKALVELIRAMHQRFPGVKLLFNRGFAVLPEAGPLAAGLVAESLFQSWNPMTQQYMPVADNDRNWLLTRLNDAHLRYGLPITVIDYVSPDKPELAQETARQITALGFTPWVSTPGLDMIGVGVEK
ncbi:MAG: endo alpha-1,4 polygalactosaminidase [Polaromonas sp.]